MGYGTSIQNIILSGSIFFLRFGDRNLPAGDQDHSALCRTDKFFRNHFQLTEPVASNRFIR
jgi:hypothetical protein